MRKICLYLLILLQIAILSGCGVFIQKHEDPFYNDVGTWDSANLPLINPYSLVYIDEEYGWQMPTQANFPQEYYYYGLGDLLHIEKVAVENGIVMVYTPEIRDVDESAGQKPLHWFVMIPDKGNSEMGFDNEEQFLGYIQAYDISSPAWIEPDIAYREFYKTGCFDWIPDCR